MTTVVLKLQSLSVFSIGDVLTESSTGKKSMVIKVGGLSIDDVKMTHNLTTVPLSKYRIKRWFQIKYYRFKYRRKIK